MHSTYLAAIREIVRKNAARVATLGNWPSWINAEESLTSRVPADGGEAPGFDAGIACAMDLIPREKQGLAATLHAAYTPDAVAQVRREVFQGQLDPESEACWWLAACYLCKEGKVSADAFVSQIDDFREFAADPLVRQLAAQEQALEMINAFERDTYGVPFGTEDGCIQGAYLAGYRFGTTFAENYGIYFIGTFLPSLGLEDFPWSDEKDEQGRPKSGPVFGSKQYVKCANEDEFRRAVEVVKAKLGR
jgi:hypothetical protein